MDLTNYLIGDGSPIGMSHKTADGKAWAADNIHQMVRGPLPDQWQLCKGHIAAPCRSEELRVVTVNGKRYVARGWDTSDRPNVYRLTEGALPVSPWCPLDFDPDGWFRRAAAVERFNYASGAKVAGPDTHVTWIHFDDILFEWRNPGDVSVGKVIVLTVHDGEDGKNKPPFETYYYAERYGMVYWKDHASGRESYVNNTVWPNGVPQLRAESLPKGHTFKSMPTAPIGVTPPITPPTTWKWYRPVRAPFVITSSYGERVKPEDWDKPPAEQRKELHPATDYTAADWTAYAAQDGVVVFAGWDTTGYGNLIKIDHGGGRVSLYAHLESFAVTVGERVSAGQKIGVIGSTGRSTARHLHWETRLNNVAYAPAPETQPHPLDAKPVTPPVTEPVTPEPEPDTSPAFEVMFDTPEDKARAADIAIAIFQRIKEAPGRRVYISVTTEQ